MVSQAKAYRLDAGTGKYEELFDFAGKGVRRINGAAYNGNFRS